MTATAVRHRVIYNTGLMTKDMAERGWNQADLARVSGRHKATIGRFFAHEIQTAGVAKDIADALGQAVSRYVVRVKTEAA